MQFTHNAGNGLAALAGVFWIGLGVWYVVKVRNPDVRAQARRILDGESLTMSPMASIGLPSLFVLFFAALTLGAVLRGRGSH